ncbi:MAG: prepilin-type N-terminal cleavage/methylation domain-containing protein, partial [Planctomycetota bacterium]|nr:prepilin-type N-terminal cleavage/methylation domain-containing protein [Planctomycetota bacterium]
MRFDWVRRRTRSGAFTMVELMVVTAIIMILIGLLIPVLGMARTAARQALNGTQLRGQHQAMVMYSQSKATKLPGTVMQQAYSQPLPGLYASLVPVNANVAYTGSATENGAFVGSRYWILLDAGMIVPTILISPQETTVLTPWTTGNLTTANYSYAMLKITTSFTSNASPVAVDQGRQAEWASSANSNAVLISDRNIGTNSTDIQVQSLSTAGTLGTFTNPQWK